MVSFDLAIAGVQRLCGDHGESEQFSGNFPAKRLGGAKDGAAWMHNADRL